MRATCIIPYSIAGWFFLMSALSKNTNGAKVTLESQNNWNYTIDPLSDENSSINSTSERYRRLIPYMTFYLTQGFLPQAQQYTPIATVGNNLDTNLRYQQQNIAATNIPQANTIQYPLLRNGFIVRTSVPQQQNYPQPHAIPTQQNYQPQLITTQQNYQHQLPSPLPPPQLPIQPQVQPQHQFQLQPQLQPQQTLPPTGLSRFTNYPQQPQSLRPIPITKPSYYTAQKQELPPLQYDFKPLATKSQVTTIQNQHYKQTEEELNRQEDPITGVQGPLIIPQQKQHVHPKVIIQNYSPLKSTQYNPPSAEEDQRQQHAKILYQQYNSQKQVQYPIKDIKQDITYSRPTIQNYAILPQQRYQQTETIKQDNSQPSVIDDVNYEEQPEEDAQSDNNQPEDDVMTIVQSQEIPVPQEETDAVKLTPDTKQLQDLLEGYQLSKTLPDRITSANIGSSIQTLSQILKLLQQANSLSGLNKSILGQTHHADFSSNSKGHKFLQGFSPTRTEGSTPGKAGIDYPNYFEIPPTSFNCKDQRYKGFFGDPDTNCQVWHYCDLNGGQASFLCPNGTIFSQVALTCDWWFNVKCASTAQLYVLNERLYKYILPVKPSFPEDYAGPLVDEYLSLKYYEIENKRKNGTKTAPTTTTEATPDSEYNPLQSLLTNEVKRKV